MKIIHCADIHLDSPMNTTLNNNLAVQRRHELLITFIRMNEYALENHVEMILIAGDLFDTEFVTENTRQQVMAVMEHNRDIQYVYIEGNHDEGAFIRSMVNKPGNLHCLMNGQSFDYRDITVLAQDSPGHIELESERINIVMLHGEVDIKAFAGKNIDYLAMGHIHSYGSRAIDARGIACYSGCLEGRGFDETGKKGFVLLDADAGLRVTHRFIPFASRQIIDCRVKAENCSNTAQVRERIEEALKKIDAGKKDIVRVRLTGRVLADFSFSRGFLEKSFEGQYFSFSVEDKELKPLPCDSLYYGDTSLRGTFIKNVMESDEAEEDKQKIIELGIAVLSGEEPE
ncbi:MAG: DNA repair exonuclease [Eubacteriales bacterium]|nr:DNA repair exonuclease [Eubacteriales bacterium]